MSDDENDPREQQLVDAMLDAVRADDGVRIRRLGRKLVRYWFSLEEPPWHCGWGDTGTLLRFRNVPKDPEDVVPGLGVELLEGGGSEERFAEIQEELFPSLSTSELVLWQQRAGERIFDDNPDSDAFETWFIMPVHDSERRKALIVGLLGGYSFTEPSATFLGTFQSESAAFDALRELGYIIIEDYRLWHNARRPMKHVTRQHRGKQERT
jgi:hypothetical protein